MSNDAYLQIRTALDATTNNDGGDQRSGIGAVFVQKEIERMIVETKNLETDFAKHVPRKTMTQLAAIWNLKTSLGATSKTAVYTDGGTGTPYPNDYLQLFAAAISYRSDYEVTGLAQAASSSYFDAMQEEASDALRSHAFTEEQMMLLGDDASAEATGLTLNSLVGVTNGFKGLKQLLSSAAAVGDGDSSGFADASTVYGSTRSSTITDKEYMLNCKVVSTAQNATNPLSTDNLNKAITVGNINGAKRSKRIFLCSEHRMDEISDLIAPEGRFIRGATMAELDGGLSVLSWKRIPIISSRLMALFGVTSNNGSSVTFTDADNAMCLLDMDNIVFYNVAGVDTRHVPIMGSDSGSRYDVEGGYFKTYGVMVMKKFNTQVVIWNLTAPN